MAMEWEAVSSSNVAEIGYDKDTNTLGVRFKNNSEYHYPNVPIAVFTEFQQADSKGRFMNDNIKYTYSYRKI